MAERFGQPEPAEFRIDVSGEELDRIRSSQKDGRNHDVTLYIHKEGRIVVIAKPMYPPGMYRAPSGGIKPGESIVAGIDREVAEETGCRIELERFLLRTDVAFVGADVSPDDSIRWRSLVFQARYLSGDFQFTDHDEITEVRLATLDEFEEFSRIMRDTDTGGLHYRAALHDTVKGLLSFDQSR
ncbi:MAG: NUDIX hydrolase [candidate division Zixibacteria bacterium]|nr:NUDIX hydrolase [candidate division Zixibacteria bacterium]MDH3937732.1 NUDIX hydrolase [candidate division Zixibacteria bacterium]MDH4033745.1 NUDIX hydrolase [candidate division Zixibacteria bacterium]